MPDNVQIRDLAHFLEEAQTVPGSVFRGQTQDYGILVPALFRQELQIDIEAIESLLTRYYLDVYDKVHFLSRKAEWGRTPEPGELGMVGMVMWPDNIFEAEPFWYEPTDTDKRILQEIQDNIEQYREEAAFIASYGDKIYSLARLQHYGVPTSGLDVTYDASKALWFATHRFQPTGPKCGYYVRDANKGVVYVLRVPTSQLGDLTKQRVIPLSGLRAVRQQGALVLGATRAKPDLSGYIMKRLFVSAELLSIETYDQNYLLPPPSEDKFYAFLLEGKKRGDGSLHEVGNWVMEYVSPPSKPK